VIWPCPLVHATSKNSAAVENPRKSLCVVVVIEQKSIAKRPKGPFWGRRIMLNGADMGYSSSANRYLEDVKGRVNDADDPPHQAKRVCWPLPGGGSEQKEAASRLRGLVVD
jgi:hypothetical protein